MARVIRCVDSAGATLGEGPVWHPLQRALFWVDIHGAKIHRYDPADERSQTFPSPFRIGSLAPREGGGFIAGSERGFVAIDETLSRFELILEPEPDLPGNRFNDGKLDLEGRFWAGTMDDAEQARTGALYRLDGDLECTRHACGYRVPNGPAFSPDGRYMYHTDSAERTIYRFTLTPEGELRGKTTFCQFAEGHGHPDGMTTDSKGRLWIAFWDGWCIRQLSPEGAILQEIEMPVQRPTSCAFGGERLDTLFVTSARIGLDPDSLARQPAAGALFAIDGLGTGTTGPLFGS